MLFGYSYYCYANKIFETSNNELSNNIQFLSIDELEPNMQTIQDDSYPFTTTYYIVTNSKNNKAQELAQHMLSTRGKKVAIDAGYVPAE